MNKLIRSPQGTARPIAGSDRDKVKLINGARNSFLTAIARTVCTVSVAAATSLRNRGSVWSLIDEFALDENGADRSIVKGRVLRFASEMDAPSALTAKRIVPLADGTIAVGVYVLEEAARLYFANPASIAPLETSYVEHDSRASFNAAVKSVPDLTAALFVKGPATVAFTQPTVTIIQGYELPGPNGLPAPYFIPIVQQQVETIAGDVSQQPAYLHTTNLIRKLVLSQETTTDGEVSDIVRKFSLKGDFRPIIGATPIVWSDVALESEFEFGGAVISSNRAHLGLNFQRFGQLSECLNPGQDLNLRVELDALPSVTGAGTSQVRITRFELMRDPAVCAKVVPFPY